MPSKQLHVWGASSLYVNELCFKEHRGFECKLHRQIFIKHPNKKNKNKKKGSEIKNSSLCKCASVFFSSLSCKFCLGSAPRDSSPHSPAAALSACRNRGHQHHIPYFLSPAPASMFTATTACKRTSRASSLPLQHRHTSSLCAHPPRVGFPAAFLAQGLHTGIGLSPWDYGLWLQCTPHLVKRSKVMPEREAVPGWAVGRNDRLQFLMWDMSSPIIKLGSSSCLCCTETMCHQGAFCSVWSLLHWCDLQGYF